jgi:hypothetical protein
MEKKIYNSCGHNLLGYKLSYIAHQEYAEKKYKRGVKQKQCDKCGLFIFPEEKKTSKENIGKIP